MSKFSEYLNNRKESNLKYYFGNDVKLSGGDHDTVFKFTHNVDNDNIILVTNNIKNFKGNYVLVVSNDKVVYLKDWQVMLLKNWDLEVNTYAVKLNRNYFKPYQLSFTLDDMSFDKEDTFDSLKEVAAEQDNSNISWKFGHYDCI